ncbi:MAG: hypothetical protein LBD58_06100 [Treponema sp.]|jgi:hypothetical protein|nr:hypothetical protein [Treponema sp.]
MSGIPSKDAEFVEWSGSLIGVSKNRKAERGRPEDKLSALETLRIEAKSPREKRKTASYAKSDMREKNEKSGPLKKKEEEFVRFHLQNDGKAPDNGRKELRIPICDKTPAPRPAPDIEIDTPRPRTLRLTFRHENAARRGKPQFVHGLECPRLVADAPPEKALNPLHSSFAARSPLELTFMVSAKRGWDQSDLPEPAA